LRPETPRDGLKPNYLAKVTTGFELRKHPLWKIVTAIGDMRATISLLYLNLKTSVIHAKSQESETKSGRLDTVRTFSGERQGLGSRIAVDFRMRN
jgi:hypothetical protein